MLKITLSFILFFIYLESASSENILFVSCVMRCKYLFCLIDSFIEFNFISAIVTFSIIKHWPKVSQQGVTISHFYQLITKKIHLKMFITFISKEFMDISLSELLYFIASSCMLNFYKFKIPISNLKFIEFYFGISISIICKLKIFFYVLWT
jgi:hypothetical protein